MSVVTLAVRDGIALVEIDSPPVNATSQAVRAGLLAAIRQADGDASVRAIVIAAAGRTFVAGGDITEFDKPPAEPHLPDVLDRIEACGKPVVVAWHGTALGGGCEIGLAAHARIMAPDAQLGLPEVKIGVVPGAGGTQRLPRLIGALPALDIIASGRMVGAGEALKLGLVDRIAEGDLRQEAMALAQAMAGHLPQRLSARSAAPVDAAAWDAAVAKVTRDARGRIAPVKAASLVRLACETDFAEGRKAERQMFLELRGSDQSRALRHIFFAEREVSRVPGLDGVKPAPVETVGVIGAGTMGSGIAVAFLDAGYRVILIETSQAALEAGQARLTGLYARQIKSGRITAAIMEERLARLTGAADVAALASADLVIEAVFEEMQVKRDLFARILPHLKAAAILATNTSYLDIEAMADDLPDPSRFIGLHFFSPANVMKLLEIVRGRRTSPETLATGLAVGRRLKKIAVVSGVCDGFIGNRILAAWRVQCEFMLEEGALPQEIDAAMEAFGLAMGPFAVQDLAGLDIAWARRKRLAPTRNPADRYVPLADRLCEQERFGQKAGQGWYRYVDGKREIDPAIEALVKDHAAASGRAQQPLAAGDIQMRVLAAMANEGAKIVEEGIAARPLDVDVVLVNGYGFPAWRGGPMHEADRVGLGALLELLEESARRDGPSFTVSPLLRQLAAEGRRFDDLNRR